jgi:superfamily I DNA/RNA helicase
MGLLVVGLLMEKTEVRLDKSNLNCYSIYMTTITFSPQQQAVLDAVQNTRKNLMITAVAGSGKTFTLIEILKILGSYKVAFCAFSKNISVEIQNKVNPIKSSLKCDPFIGTCHSFGMSAITKTYGKKGSDWINDKKIDNLMDIVTIAGSNEVGVPDRLRLFVKKLYRLSRQWGVGVLPEFNFNRQEAWMNLIEHFDVQDELFSDNEDRELFDVDDLMNQGIVWTIACIKLGVKVVETVIDFEDMIYIPLYNNLKMWTYQVVLVDECQDINPTRCALIKKMTATGGRTIFVGDACQPLGTKIPIIKEKANRWYPEILENLDIENVKIGDSVISYSKSDCTFIKGREVTGITRKSYDGRLIVVSVNDTNLQSKYTINHHCLANFKSLRNKWCVYLMQKGSNFRIGKCRMEYGDGGNGIRARFTAENADAAWILSVHDTEIDSLIDEMQISTNFGLSTVMFTAKNNSAFTQDHYDRIWMGINVHSTRALKCLKQFGREFEYPLLDKFRTEVFSLKRPAIFHACNLLDGVLVLPYETGTDNHVTMKQWKPITITNENYVGDVVSFNVSGEHLYCADGIMTHNCQAIFGFTGADSDSVKNIIKNFDCVEMPLTYSFRCPKKVVEFARTWVSHIESTPDAPEGEYKVIDSEKLLDENLTVNDAILCRNNAPLVDLFFKFLAKGIPTHIEGKDIGEELVKLINRFAKIKNRTLLMDKLNDYAEKQIQKFNAQGKEMLAQRIADSVDAIAAISSHLPESASVVDLKNKITSMFLDEQGMRIKTLTLTTIHKFKGRESERVFWYGRNLYNPSPYARKDWQKVAEDNLCYVAATRAKSILVDVRATAKPKKFNG